MNHKPVRILTAGVQCWDTFVLFYTFHLFHFLLLLPFLNTFPSEKDYIKDT